MYSFIVDVAQATIRSNQFSQQNAFDLVPSITLILVLRKQSLKSIDLPKAKSAECWQYLDCGLSWLPIHQQHLCWDSASMDQLKHSTVACIDLPCTALDLTWLHKAKA